MDAKPGKAPGSGGGAAVELGAMIREARLARALELDAVSEELMLRQSYLQAIEDGRFSDLPGTAYAVGYVRTYADYLGLDSEEAVRRFKGIVGAAAPTGTLVPPAPDEPSRLPGGVILLVAAVIAVLAYGVWYYLTQRDGGLSGAPFEASAVTDGANVGRAAPPEPTPAPQSQSARDEAPKPQPEAEAEPGSEPEAQTQPQTDPQPAPPTASASAPVMETQPAPTPDSEPESEPESRAVAAPAPIPQSSSTSIPTPAPETAPESVQSASEPAQPAQETAPPLPPAPSADSEPQPANPPEPASAVAPPADDASNGGASNGAASGDGAPGNSGIVIRATADSWIEIRDDAGVALISRVLRVGERYQVPADGAILITGNAGALQVLVDGVAVPALGPEGAVRRDIALDPARLRAGGE